MGGGGNFGSCLTGKLFVINVIKGLFSWKTIEFGYKKRWASLRGVENVFWVPDQISVTPLPILNSLSLKHEFWYHYHEILVIDHFGNTICLIVIKQLIGCMWCWEGGDGLLKLPPFGWVIMSAVKMVHRCCPCLVGFNVCSEDGSLMLPLFGWV